MPARVDDRSEAHLRWLVENRSANQQTTLELYLVLNDNKDIIDASPVYIELGQEISGVAFSLWRAVFLADFQENDDQLYDAKTFLGNLISNNSIGYPQDRGAREWTFQYYLTDAQRRIERLVNLSHQVVELSDIESKVDTAKEEWKIAQRALEKAVNRFADLTRSK